MHNLFLGLIQEHFQGILGIRLAKVSDADTRPVLDITFSNRTGNNLTGTISLATTLNGRVCPKH